MKKLHVNVFYTFTLIALLLGTPPSAHASHTANTPEKMQAGHVNQTGTLIEIGVNGLVCDFCARTLEKIFMKRSDVAGIDVSLDESRILISMQNGKDIEDAELNKLVTDAGYNISAITRKAGHA
ncbi:MAG: heavy-metal-associated domain-containing protein [Alphaproteobacteria bacterium]|nr:heavy-metal-associated domain-containing protein [Alphaproteobacteria bacterium]